MSAMRACATRLLPAIGLGLLLLAGGPAHAEAPGCGAPPETLDALPLPGTFAALAEGELRIMVVGSASTHAGGTSGPAATWPERLRAVLGTVEAARGLPAYEMSDAVQETLARLHATRGERTDVVLVDQQFSRFLRANADVETYRDRMRLAAAAGGAQLFSRWTIMRHWAETDRLDLERAPRAQRVAMADELHDCLARALTEFLLDGTLHARR